MIGLQSRQTIAQEVIQAHRAGARLAKACEVAGISPRTLERWRKTEGLSKGDGRPLAIRPTPPHALSVQEREVILMTCNEPRFADMPPSRIVPKLADEAVYLASESSFYRVLRRANQLKHRGRARQAQRRRPPTTHVAQAPGELWAWDMTYLPARVIGLWYYLYLILDVYSRKIVGWEVHATDDSDHAIRLVRKTALAEGIANKVVKPVLHGDNGSTLKATTVVSMLAWLQIKPSYSRPRVSNDNAYAESLFRTAKYRPEFPGKGFESLEAARDWAMRFACWYNTEHLHSGIRYVTPHERHQGSDRLILEKRHRLYQNAKAANPARWSGNTRNWTPIGAVTLNPEKEERIPLKNDHHLKIDKYA
jgi:putative transposase